MPNKDYYPKTDERFLVWFDNFIDKAQVHAATIGLTPADITQFQNDFTDAAKQVTDVENSRTTTQALVKKKNDLFDQVEKLIRDKVVILKRQSGYTKSIGEDLGVVPAEAGLGKGLPIENIKPSFAPTIMPDRVRLDWVKSEFDGVVIQCKRGNEINFSLLGKDNVSPYEDMRPSNNPDTPETRIYRMRYLIKDNEVGQWSDESRIICLI